MSLLSSKASLARSRAVASVSWVLFVQSTRDHPSDVGCLGNSETKLVQAFSSSFTSFKSTWFLPADIHSSPSTVSPYLGMMQYVVREPCGIISGICLSVNVTTLREGRCSLVHGSAGSPSFDTLTQ